MMIIAIATILVLVLSWIFSYMRKCYFSVERPKRPVTKIAFDFDSTLTVGLRMRKPDPEARYFGSDQRIEKIKSMLKRCKEKGIAPYIVSSASYGWVCDIAMPVGLWGLFDGVYCRSYTSELDGNMYSDKSKSPEGGHMSLLWCKLDVYHHLCDGWFGAENMMVVDDDDLVLRSAAKDGFSVYRPTNGYCGEGLSDCEIDAIAT